MFGPVRIDQLAGRCRSSVMSFGTNGFAGRRGPALDDGMPRVDDDHLVAVVDVRLGVVVDGGGLGQRGEHVERGERARRRLNPRRLGGHRARAASRRVSSSRSRMRSSAPSTFSSYSFSAGVMKRSPPAIVCLRW